MIASIIEGIGLGLLLAVMVGPIFFALMHITIHTEKKYAIAFSLGSICADTILAIIVIQGLTQFVIGPLTQQIGGAIGGMFFIGIGLWHWKKKNAHSLAHIPDAHIPDNQDMQEHGASGHKRRTLFMHALQGFSMSIVYPGVIVFWIGIVGTFLSHNNIHGRGDVRGFVGAIIITLITTDMIKILGATKIKQTLTPQKHTHIKKITAIIMMFIGTLLLFRSTVALFYHLPYVPHHDHVRSHLSS